MAVGDLQSLGQMLRQAREARALTLEEVEAQTRIRIKYLQALENGDLSILPSVAHARGFLRNYAQFLRLDANAILAQFGELSGSATRPMTVPAAAQPRTAPPPYPTTPAAPSTSPVPVQPRRPVYIPPSQRVGPAGPVTQPAIATTPLPAEAAEELPTPKPPSLPRRILRSNIFVAAVLLSGLALILWWAIAQLSKLSIETLAPTPQDANLLGQLAGSATFEPTPTFQPTSTPTLAVGPQILDRVLLTIEVEQRSWVRIIVDGQITFEGQAEPGMVLRYEGMQSIRVLGGNGAGLVVTYNGMEIGPLGQRGEVVERIFTPSEQITPTPTPTVTPTSTSVPTPTPRISATPTPR